MSFLRRVWAWRNYIGLSLGWLAVLAVVLLITRRPSGEPIEILPPPTLPAAATALPSPTPAPLRVDVSGAVRSPGVYVLPAGSIVADALAAAGGGRADADLDRLNKAAALQDGMQIYVPIAGSEPALPLLSHPAPTVHALSGAGTTPIDLNTATLAQLETLPEVGPTLAQRIIEGRPYRTIDDLLNVRGIGSAILEQLRDLVAVR